MISKLLIGGYLFVGSILDLKRRYLSIYFLAIMCPIIIIHFYLVLSLSYIQIGLGLGLMIGLLLISKLSKEAIGSADCIIIGGLGVMLGVETQITILLIASILSSVVGILLLIVKKANKKTRLPFLPFLFLGYLIKLTM